MKRLSAITDRFRTDASRAAALIDECMIPRETDFQALHVMVERHAGGPIDLVPFDHPGGSIPTGWTALDSKLGLRVIAYSRGEPLFENYTICHEYGHILSNHMQPIPVVVAAGIEQFSRMPRENLVATRDRHERYMEAISYELVRRASAGSRNADDRLSLDSVLAWRP